MTPEHEAHEPPSPSQLDEEFGELSFFGETWALSVFRRGRCASRRRCATVCCSRSSSSAASKASRSPSYGCRSRSATWASGPHCPAMLGSRGSVHCRCTLWSASPAVTSLSEPPPAAGHRRPAPAVVVRTRQETRPRSWPAAHAQAATVPADGARRRCRGSRVPASLRSPAAAPAAPVLHPYHNGCLV